ncbi:MAG: TauD/TfdA family dioxygenase [Cyanobacteria bacterium]|nr:TauD/TfdA family dioxygenase [Cyanobacteriota bacterium]
MSSHSFISWAAAAALLLAPMAAAGQHHGAAPPTPTIDRQPPTPDHAAKASGKKADIQLSQPTRVAGTLLEPGYYRVQMQREGDRHVLVLARRDTVLHGRTAYGTGAGREVLRVPCTVTEGEKNANTVLRLRNDGGVSVLNTVRVKGESGTHVITAGSL